MTDLSSLSDADLMGMLQPQQTQSPLASMSDADLMKALGQPAQANSGYGGATGAANLAAIKEGFSPEGGMGSKIAQHGVLQGFLDTGKALAAIPQYLQSPLTEAIRNYGGAGISAADKAIRQGAVNIYGEDKVPPALTPEEAASKAETAFNALAPKGTSPVGTRITVGPAPKPTIEKVLEAGQGAYKSPIVEDLTWKPDKIGNLADSILGDLKRGHYNAKNAGGVISELESLKEPVSGRLDTTGSVMGPVHTYEDIQTTRERLSDFAGNFTEKTQQGAAIHAIKKLDTYISNIPQSHLLTGDAAQASKILTAGRVDYASAKTAQKVAEQLKSADLNTASAHSGGNYQNAVRQSLKPLLKSKKAGRGLTEDELATIEANVRAPRSANILRGVGKVFGGGGGLGMAHGAGWGWLFGGPVGAAVVPAAGYGVRKTGDILARASANKIVDQILARSSYARNLPPFEISRSASLGPSSQTIGGLLSSSSPRALFPLLPGQLPAYADRNQERQRRRP